VNAQLSLGTTAITGRVYNAATYSGLSGWCVTVSGPVTATVGTDGSGNYSITGLPAGTYTICEVLQTGWQASFPGSWSGTTCQTGYGWTFPLADGEIGSYVNFGNVTAP